MLILEDLSAEVPDTNAFHWDLKEHSADDGKSVLMYGYNACENHEYLEQCSDYDRKIYFNNWAPCEFAQARSPSHDALHREEWFNEVYSICPYTNKWLNSLNLGREYKDVFYPFHEALIPDSRDKEYDVIYHGGIHGMEHIECLNAMRPFNYRYCTMTNHINNLTMQCLPYATNVNLCFKEKIDLIAQTKISICYNLVHVNPEHVPCITSYDNWRDNEAFSEIGSWNVMPQFKTRVHEAAISKTLNLVQRDSWNVIEKYYEPDTEFIYFENSFDLSGKLKDILGDWKNYQAIVDSAYQKSLSYTTDNFIKNISTPGGNNEL
jgi:hypothetical protein